MIFIYKLTPGRHPKLAVLREEFFGDVGSSNHKGNEMTEQLKQPFTIERMQPEDIEPGEELTVDYAEFSDVNWSMECHCGSKNCKGIVKGKVA